MAERSIYDAVDEALYRGAITAATAQWWIGQGDAAAETVDGLAGIPVFATSGPRPVTAAGGRPFTTGQSRPGGDPLYAANPLLEEMRQAKPELVHAAAAEAPDAPRLFGDGDLPLFTASGLDPSILARMPWPIRRPMAEAPTIQAAYELASRYEGNPDMARVDLAHDPVNESYVSAFSNWLAGQGGHPADRRADSGVAASGRDAYTTEQLHSELFGPRAGAYGG
jgi:hypothetical protein